MELGTLWFGADIDLTKLRQKIANGNQSILDALKMNYDPQSYSQMVSKLKTQLASETFDIKINTNAQAVSQSLKNTLNGISNGINPQNLNLSNLKGIPKLTSDIAEHKDQIYTLSLSVKALKREWQDAAKMYGKQSRQAKDAYKEYIEANTALRSAQMWYSGLQKNKVQAIAVQQQLNKEQREAAKIAKQWNSDSMRLNTTLAGGIHISTQLGSALSGLFAVDYVRQFLGNVIEIGGQLEKQRISIGAILGDTVKASHLFEQIKGLALKSPFGVVELDQYTKQLSAYGFKYSELFDMTKRLADISAGAGTDIGRLTLALGHVRSATYLTGITLRQFSMNNIPMLKMLADYYTEVEKKAVSTAEVQKRISERKVSYEDVIEQIRRLTDEGGMFYNMQEKISESVAAKFKNLRDAMDIMYGEMAEGFTGDALKGLATQLLTLTKSWREIASVLGAATAAWVINKLYIGYNTAIMQGNTRAALNQIMATKKLEANNLRATASYRALTDAEKVKIATSKTLTAADIQKAIATEQLTKDEVLNAIALKKVSAAEAQALVTTKLFTQAEIDAALKAKLWDTRLASVGSRLRNMFAGFGAGAWATIGFMVGAELWSAYNTWADRIDDKAREMTDLIKSRVNDLKKIQKSIDEDGKPKDKTALKSRIDEMKQVLANSEEYTKTIDEQLSKTTDLNGQYDILVTAIDNAAEKNRKMLDYQGEVANMIKASKGDFSWWDIPKAGILSLSSFKNIWNQLFDEDINKNMQQTLESYKDLRTVIDNAWEYKDAIKGVIEEMVKSGEISESFAEQLKKAPFEEQIRLLAESGYWQTIVDKIASTDSNFITFANNIKNASNGVTDKWKEIATNDIPKMMQKVASERHINEQELNKWCLNNIDDFKMMLDGIADQLDIKEPEIRNRLKRLFYNYVSFGKLAQGNVSQEVLSQTEKDLMDFIGVEDENLKKLLGYDEKAVIKDKTNSDPTKGDKKDKALEAARTKLAQYKAFLSEYKKYREIYDKEDSINLLKDLFPDLKDEKGNFLGLQLVDNYTAVLDKLRSSIEATTEARKKFHNDIDKTKADTQFDREKQSLKENADAMKEYYTKMEEQWKNYRSLLEKSGGNREIANMAFNDNGRIWDETAKNMLETFNKKAKELGVSPTMDFNWNMNESQLKKELVNSKGLVQTELVELAKEIQKVTKDNFVKFTEDTAEAYKKSLTEAQKLVALEAQLSELKNKRESANSNDDKAKYDIQIAAKEKEIANQTWEAFKETEQWGRIFANLDNISTSTLQSMLQKLQNIVPQLKLSEEATKQVYEAMDKLHDKVIERNPFKALSDSVQYTSRLHQLLNSGAIRGGFTPNSKSASYYGLKEGHTYTKEEIENLFEESKKNFSKGLEGLSAGLKAVQDVMQPVIDLFDQLGNTALSDFFSTSTNAFGAAAQAANGLNTLGLGTLSPYGAAAAASVSLVSSLFALSDKNLQKEIEASQARQKEMSNLTENIERILKRTLGGQYNLRATDQMLKELQDVIGSQYVKKPWGEKTAYTSDKTKEAVKNAEKTKTYYDYTYASLLAQRDEVAHQMETEQKKKKSDATAIQNYKKDLAELDDEIKNFAIDMANALYSIDIKSWASQLGDALFEAWQKGESGADAFKKKASEIMAELSKNIAVTKLIETAMQPVLDIVVSEMERTKGLLDEQSTNEIASKMAYIGTTLPDSFNALMDGINEGIKKAGLTDMKELANESSSATQNGIGKAITEQDTSLWSSYLNGIRLDVSVIRATEALHLPIISTEVHRVSVLAQAQVDHLQQIADNTKRNADAADKIYSVMRGIETGNVKVTIK